MIVLFSALVLKGYAYLFEIDSEHYKGISDSLSNEAVTYSSAKIVGFSCGLFGFNCNYCNFQILVHYTLFFLPVFTLYHCLTFQNASGQLYVL